MLGRAGTIGKPFQGRINDLMFDGLYQMRPRLHLRLSRASTAADGGLILFNANNGFSGDAPT